MASGSYKTVNKRYSIEDYDPNWEERFEEIKELLIHVFQDKVLQIEHIGSTSIPGMSAKPIIDVLVVVEKIEPFKKQKEMLARLGYQNVDNYIKENSLSFSKDVAGDRLENIHFFPQNHYHISEVLDVRDYLRTHPDKMREYENLKVELFNKYPDDYIQYRKHKDSFLKKLVSTAQKWRLSS